MAHGLGPRPNSLLVIHSPPPIKNFKQLLKAPKRYVRSQIILYSPFFQWQFCSVFQTWLDIVTHIIFIQTSDFRTKTHLDTKYTWWPFSFMNYAQRRLAVSTSSLEWGDHCVMASGLPYLPAAVLLGSKVSCLLTLRTHIFRWHKQPW